jgi:hypothetical protein
VNGTCGCPYPFNITTTGREDDLDAFANCTEASDPNALTLCGPALGSAARAAHVPGLVRWNLAVVVLGVTVIMGAMGV